MMATAVAAKPTMAGEGPGDGEHFLRLYRQQLVKELAEVDRRLGQGIIPDR